MHVLAIGRAHHGSVPARRTTPVRVSTSRRRRRHHPPSSGAEAPRADRGHNGHPSPSPTSAPLTTTATGTGAPPPTAGDVELKIPELRSGRFFPSLRERRRPSDR
ncbi:hypothetical protein CDO52_07020 [Nocardiopsis gilva YIM 90087]|uniref:Uncharacterized protein n=1 Tax=Nocardiopsis gilva YIM 90087 TaxID=1235441 RepID=A0A223S3B4_9ACTN|nr:hypothetical protein CDO52_07020 [Nocardiopsis gilva YIM 90087]